MKRVINNPDGDRGMVRVEVSPEEILFAPYYLPGPEGGAPRFSGDTIQDAIRRWAWRSLWLHVRKLVEGVEFKFGDVEVQEGNFVVTFYREIPGVPDEPGPA